VESVAVHSKRWKLIQNTARPEGVAEFELYDRAEDPFEQRNLADRSPDVVERLHEELDGWRARTRAARLPGAAPGRISPDEEDRLRALGYGD
jgi:arylsulfatase A-like enzyme